MATITHPATRHLGGLALVCLIVVLRTAPARRTSRRSSSPEERSSS